MRLYRSADGLTMCLLDLTPEDAAFLLGEKVKPTIDPKVLMTHLVSMRDARLDPEYDNDVATVIRYDAVEEVSTRVAAKVIGCTTRQVRRLCSTGKLAARRPEGADWLIERWSVSEYAGDVRDRLAARATRPAGSRRPRDFSYDEQRDSALDDEERDSDEFSEPVGSSAFDTFVS